MNLCLLILVNVIDACHHILLLLLENVKVVKCEDHSNDESDEEPNGLKIWVCTFVVLKHDQAFTMTHFVLLQDRRILTWNLLLLAVDHLFTYVMVAGIFLSLRLVALLHLAVSEESAFLLIESVEVDIHMDEGRQEDEGCGKYRYEKAVFELCPLDEVCLHLRVLHQLGGYFGRVVSVSR